MFQEPIYTSATMRLCFGKGDVFQQLQGHENRRQISVSSLVMIQNDAQATEQGWSGLEGK